MIDEPSEYQRMLKQYTILKNELKIIQENVEKVKELARLQMDSAHSSEYMRGLANGLKIAEAVFTGADPKFIEPRNNN